MVRIVCTVAILLVGCTPATQEYDDAEVAFQQIKGVLMNFHVANEWHYAARRSYSADLAILQRESKVERDYEWPYADSVDLEVALHPSRNGWTAVGTHVRLGPAVGCVLSYGRRLPVQTPAGVPYDSSNQIVCDEVVGRND